MLLFFYTNVSSFLPVSCASAVRSSSGMRSCAIVLCATFAQVGQFYMVYLDEQQGRKEYHVSDEAFSSEEDALRAASKKTNLRSQLLSFCQVS